MHYSRYETSVWRVKEPYECGTFYVLNRYFAQSEIDIDYDYENLLGLTRLVWAYFSVLYRLVTIRS